MQIKDRLHRSYSLISIAVLVLMGITILISTQRRISRKLETELTQTNLIVYKMVENVFDINKSTLLRNLGILEKQLNSMHMDRTAGIHSDAEHYITQLTDYIDIDTLHINDQIMFEDRALVDNVAELTGGHASILQMVPHGLLRISTNIRRTDGTRATQVYYPNDSIITRTIREGKVFVGKLFEMDQWHMVAFKPLEVEGEVIGAIQVGIKPDIAALRKHILDIRIGQTGIPFIVDTEGILVISPRGENENVYHLPHIKRMIQARTDGFFVYESRDSGSLLGKKIVMAHQYQPDMQWIIASGSPVYEFYGELGFISWIIIVSVVMALLTIVLVSRRLAENISNPINMLTSNMIGLRNIQYDFSNFAEIDRIRNLLDEIPTQEEEIQVLKTTFRRMLEELEEAQREMISKHRKYREQELIKKVDGLLASDNEILLDQDINDSDLINEEAAGDFFDMSPGPNGQTWYLIGFSRESNESSGFFMMLAQTFLNSVLKNIDDITPPEAVDMLNGYLSSVIREVNPAGHSYMFSLLVSSSSGWTQYVGEEKDIIIYKESGQRFERVRTQKTYSAESLQIETRTALFKLNPGNLLFLPGNNKVLKTKDINDTFSRIVNNNWNETADEISILFRNAVESQNEGSSPCLFILKQN